MSIKNIVTGQVSKVTSYNPSTGQVDGISTTGNIVTTAGVLAANVSLGTGNLLISGNLISSTADTITIDPLGDGTPLGNLIVSGSMQVIGTLTFNDVVNATTNDLQWIAANNAINPAAATGGGLSVGPLGAYAQFTFNSGLNAWQSSLPIIANGGVNANGALSGATTGSFSGDVTAAQFIGDGSLLTGLPAGYTDADVAAYLPIYTGNLDNVDKLTASGNIAGDYFIGNGSQLTGLPASYTNANVAAYLPTYTGNLDNVDKLTASGNIAGDYFIGNGSQLTGISTLTSLISNGTSNVSIATTNGNIGLAVNGTSVGTISESQLSLGANAASSGQLANAIAIGTDAGKTNQQVNSVAIGLGAATSSQGANAIAIGAHSGGVNQAANSISIGANAQSSAGAVVLNATGANVVGANVGFYVAPIRDDNPLVTASPSYAMLVHNSVTNEISRVPAAATSLASFAKYKRASAQSVAVNSAVICNVAEALSGTDVSVNTTTGSITLQAGRTYRLRGTVGDALRVSPGACIITFQWFNVTTNALIGMEVVYPSPSADYNSVQYGGTAEVVITPTVTTVVQLRVKSLSNVNTIGSSTANDSNPWIDIQVIGGYAPTIGTIAQSGTVLCPLADSALLGTSSATATTALTYNIPGSGTWKIDACVITNVNGGDGAYGTYALFTSGGIELTNTRSMIVYQNVNATIGAGTNSFIVTTSGPATYTIRVWGTGLRIKNGLAFGYTVGNYTQIGGTAVGASTLVTKGSGLVNRGVDVTLGNLNARVAATGNRSLQLSTVTGTYQVYGSSTEINATGVTFAARTIAAPGISITTTPTYIFAAHDLQTGGDTTVWLLVDATAGVAWRISLIVGTSANNNMISIEQLV